jgi:L-asparaginase/Glu-tRNA(Gln) amidotransferase subunit D
MNLRAIELVLSNSKGVIIAGYGMGNLPTDNVDLMRLIKHAV